MSTGQKIVFYAPKDIRVEPTLPTPEPSMGEVLVRVEACAICGSDVKTYLNGNPRITPPRTMGHEFCGMAQAVGTGVASYKIGQRVTMATTMGCGNCPPCLAW
ncbi:MAG: alcohol dehydrogenase catalytic domain-containing protein [Phycisphaeraceae bacterium]|nr:alcohol dehydrogenase catalytic domain-containing protein [Phycisphaeraceae bacterium]